jgi:PAS domain S-box-containing protein
MSKVSETVLGYHPEELEGRVHFYDLFAESTREETKKAVFKFFEQKEPFVNFVCAVQAKDGHLVWLSINGIPLLDAKGRLTGYRGSLADITDRKRVEEILKIQHELLLDLNSCHDLYQGLDTVLQAVLKLECFDCGGIYTVDAADHSLNLAVHRGLSPEFVSCSSHYPADSPQVRLLSNGEARYDTYTEICQKMNVVCEKEGLHALAAIPFISQGQLIAVLNMASRTRDSVPTETRRALETIALHIGGILLRLRTSAALRVSEEKYRALVENAQEIIMVTQEERIVFSNQTATHITGYSKEEFASGPFTQFIHPDDREMVLSYYFARLNGKMDRERIVFRGMHTNGEILWLEVSAVHIDWEGKPATLNFLTDITMRHRAEEIMAESTRLLHSVLESNPEVIVFALDDRYRYLVFNNKHKEVMSQIWGKEISAGMDMVNEVIGRSDDREKARKNFDRALQGEQFTVIEEYGDEKLGRFFWEDRYSPILSEEGTIIGLTCIILNITERLRNEAEKTKLEAINRQLQKEASLSRMAGAIAHTFNNILTVVKGYLELTINSQNLEKSAWENLTEAMNGVQRATEVSGQMRTYLGHSISERAPVDISRVCQRHLPLIMAAMPKNAVLETDLPTPGPVLYTNASQMQQILTNLVSNAWESINNGNGTIHLTVKTVSASEIPARHRFPVEWQPQDTVFICLEVADAGCGIPEQDIDTIFDPFYTTKFAGRGLGLPMVSGIVRAHGGVITVESEPGCGSVFRVFLPT